MNVGGGAAGDTAAVDTAAVDAAAGVVDTPTAPGPAYAPYPGPGPAAYAAERSSRPYVCAGNAW